MKPAAVGAGDPVLHPGSHVLIGFTLGGVHVEPSPDVVLVLGIFCYHLGLSRRGSQVPRYVTDVHWYLLLESRVVTAVSVSCPLFPDCLTIVRVEFEVHGFELLTAAQQRN